MADRSPAPRPGPAPAWAAPDSRPEEPPTLPAAGGSGWTAAPTTGPTAGPTGAPQAHGPPEVPVPLRPMTVSDRLDGALRILKLAPATVVTLTAFAIVPTHLVSALVLRDQPGLGDGQAVAALGRPLVAIFVDDTGVEVVVALLLVFLEVLGVSLVAAGIAHLLTAWYTGRALTTSEVVAAAGRCLPAVAAGWALVHLIEAAFGVLLVVPAIVPMTWFAVVAPVIGAEGLGPVRALRRSFQLTRPAFGTVLGTCLLVALVDVLLRFALSTLGQLYVDGDLPGADVVATAVGAAARLVTVPFVAGAAALLYLDLRVRYEGLDLALAADDWSTVAR